MATNPALISKDIVDLQDIEKIQFLQTLQADPAKYAAYVADKQGRIMSEVVDTKRAAFVKSSGDMARMMDMDHNSTAALYRTNDLIATQGHIISQQAQTISAEKQNIDMTRRQSEINNWYYENKRETLFVLQLMLLVLLLIVVVMGVQSMGFLGATAANYLMLFFMVVGAGVWLYRYYYTAYIRDPRFWNKRRFAGDSKSSGAAQICIGGDPSVAAATSGA